MIILNNGNIPLQRTYYVTFISDTPMTITPKYTVSGQLQYSTDLIAWNNIASNDTTISASTIYMKGRMDSNALFNSNSSSNAWEFTNATNLKISGNLNNLLNYTNPPTTLSNSCYCYMFSGCTSLIEIPENLLPATNVVYYCYAYMFSGCTSLTEIPENLLPATTLANSCYSYMLYGCTSLTKIPENLLPATTLVTYCYYNMFSGCTSLIINTTSTLGYTKQFRIPTTGTGSVGTNSLTNMLINTGGTMNGTPSINTIYYIKD